MHKKYLVSGISLLMLISFVWAGAPDAHAERVYIDITKPSFEQLPIAVPEFKQQSPVEKELARQMADALANDLGLSGLFQLIAPGIYPQDPRAFGVTKQEIDFEQWKGIGTDFLVRGLYQVQGSSLKMEVRLFDVVSTTMLLGKVFEGSLKDWPTMIHRFADELLLMLTGERGVFDTKIAFVQVDKNIKEICVIDFDGKNPVQVTQDKSISLSPEWSPEGTRIAYVSYKDGPPSAYYLDLLKGSKRLLAGFSGLNISPSWRPGTDELALTLSKDGNPDIYLLSSRGKILRKLVGSWAIDVSPTWSPDGQRLAYVSSESGNPQIYVSDLRSGENRRITFSGKYNTSPCWSPKGDWIAYSGSNGGQHDIYIIKADGSGVRQLTHGEGNSESPSWSPDGRMLTFSSTREGNSAIWVMLMNGTGVRRLTNLPGSQQLPDWSPYFKGF